MLKSSRKLALGLAAFLALMLGSAGHTTAFAAGPEAQTGSLLFYNFYISDSTNAQAQDTRLTLTNTNATTNIAVHLFLIDSATCNVADGFICLTRNQTASFLASEVDPDVQGYLLAVAVDEMGQPTQFNYLVGTAYVKMTSGHRGSLPAVVFRKNSSGSVPNTTGFSATLVFDGTEYDQMPQQVAVDDFPSQVTDDTRLIIYRPQQNLLTSNIFGANLFFIIHDDRENSYSSSKTISCYANFRLLFRSTVTTLNQPPNKIPAGSTGWLAIFGLMTTSTGTVNVPLLGATINLGSFSGARSLTTLALLPTYSIEVPVFPPNC